MADVTIKYKGANIATMDASGTKTLNTSGKYCEGDVQVVYADPEKPTQSKTVTPTASGFTVSPDSGKVLSSVVVNGDADLIASNIRSGKNIFGVDGTLVEGITPSGNKALTPSTTAQTGIDVTNYATASVAAVTKELLATLDPDFVAGNIKKDVDLFGLLGTLEGGGEDIPASRSGYTEFDIVVNKYTGKTIPCNVSGLKDWGDGTTDSTNEHTYEDYGEYTIVCQGTTFQSGTINYGGIFHSGRPNAESGICKAARIGTNVDTIATYAFTNCLAMRYIHIPDNVTTINRSVFRACYAMNRARYSANVSSFASYVFYDCRSLARLENIGNISSIGNDVMYNNYALERLDFTECTAVPTLADVDALLSICPGRKIIVPDALYNDWIAATNWTTYANQIYKQSEV